MLKFFVIIILISLVFFKIKENFNEDNICRGKLSDKEYLEHMIPHHQVAIDISVMLQKITKSPIMQDLIRKLIWTQKYEINLMKIALESLPRNISNLNKNSEKIYLPTISDTIKPNNLGLTKTFCDPHFFDTHSHMKHMKNMILNDEMYIKHMIPHHQVAVDMSKVLLKYTSNDFMIHLAYRIIRSQQAEVILLQDMLDSKFKNKSNLII